MAEAPYIKRESVTVTKYRSLKTGRFVKSRSRKTGKLLKVPKSCKREAYTYRLTTYGAYALGLRIPDQELVTKKVGQSTLDLAQGMIRDALGSTNILTELPTAEFVDVSISGRTKANQKYTLKQSLRVGPIKSKRAIIRLLIAKMMGQMEGAGFRIEYPLEIVKWRDAMKTRRETQALRVLKDVTITARVRR